MQEKVVDLKTKDGVMNTYVFHPDRPGPFPVVIFYMDSVGVREELSDMCRRLATVGYYVVMPNMYYRMVRCVDLDANRLWDPACADKLELMWKLNRHLTNTMVMEDTQVIFDFLANEPAARQGKTGCVGYCMSGRYVYRAMGVFPDRMAVGASVYGARLVTVSDLFGCPALAESGQGSRDTGRREGCGEDARNDGQRRLRAWRIDPR